jgi:hypothetical protein
MLFFDYSCPVVQQGDNYSLRFHLYTIISDGTELVPWKMLLKGVDGVVFMADSSEGRMFANLESCAQLFDAFAHYGIKSGDIPLRLQCNKRDLPGAVALASLKGELFPELSEEPLVVSALTGAGLLEGLSALSADIMRRLGVEPVMAAETSVKDVPAAELTEVPVADKELHCDDQGNAFRIEITGEALAGEGGEVTIPLRLAGGACGKEIAFKIKLSVTV